MKIKDKHFLVVMNDASGIRTVIEVKKIKSDTNTYTRGEHTWPIDTSKCAYRKGNRFFYFFHLTEGQILTGSGTVDTPTKLLKVVLKQSLAAQLVARMNTKADWGDKWLYIVLTLGLGLCGGYILGQVLPIGAF